MMKEIIKKYRVLGENASRTALLTIVMQMTTVMTCAQQIDFNLPGKETQSLEDGFVNWAVGRGKSSGATFEMSTGGDLQITVAAADGVESNAVMCNWWKDGVSRYSKLVSDGVYAIMLDGSNNYSFASEKPMGLKFTINGMPAGEHTLMAYHNNTDGLTGKLPTLQVKVNGKVMQEGVVQTVRKEKSSDAGQSYITFSSNAGETVIVEYISQPKAGETYSNTSVVVNALVFNSVDSKCQATDPQPSHLDYHSNADGGVQKLSWTAANNAVKHKVWLGTSPETMQLKTETTSTQYNVNNLSTHNVYYWRVDEIDANGNITEGDVWQFRPRRLAFPGAEGYGRYAIGGRGGVVYHVTTLDDNGDDQNPVPGSFRYGIKKISGPRTIVFDVAGVINLKTRLTCSEKYVTIAGQTAPGNGIMLRTSPFGMQSDGITRFLRMRLGHKRLIGGVIPESQENYGGDAGRYNETCITGLDGMGMAGNDHAIMDHCSISWTIDEAFSSRGAKSLTLQHTLISEALNQAGHPNYGSGTRHGYAATIGGGEMSSGTSVGSYHHNLLAHCEGRNWSLSGGLDGGGSYDGHHDIFNNVVYNWGSRATDGGSHEINFVNNFYKKGAATSQNTLMNLQLEGTGKGTQSVYCNGNIRQETNGGLTLDKQGSTYKYSTSGGQVVDWQPFVAQPFFVSLAEIETAQAAYKNTLSDVGCTMPVLDNHDERMINETLTGTYSATGSRSGKKGLIDSEEDEGCEGFDGLNIVEVYRPADWDTDGDGMPDWWEEACGLNPYVENNNEYNAPYGYTRLEEYLNWMALPHFTADADESLEVELAPYFAGYSNNPQFSVVSADGVSANIAGGTMKVTTGSKRGFATIRIKATDDDGWATMERTFNVYITGVVSGIQNVGDISGAVGTNMIFNLNGQRLDTPRQGVVVINGKKVILKR